MVTRCRGFFALLAGVGLASGVSAASDDVSTAASCYVRQHAGSPVRWMTWGDAAFARAKAENKPIYVVVGAFTSELARAMRTQSFANPDMAATLNESFVCVLADRDEQPALAAALAEFVRATKQAQGWPLNVWLTPELKPFEGATYLSPSEEWGREGLTNVVKRVSAAWQSDPDGLRARAEQTQADVAALANEAVPPAADAKVDPAKLAAAFDARRTAADPKHGGAGEPPRHLEPELWSAQFARGGADRALALATLRALVASPLRDPLDGGFFRSAGDIAWQRPVFVKTAADQARVALALLDAGAEEPPLRDVARGALRFAVKTFQTDDGGFATSVDALDEANLPALTWTAAELGVAAGEQDAAAFAAFLGAKPEGNIAEADDASGKLRGRNFIGGAPADAARWGEALAKLRVQREARIKWLRDENVRTSVNGLLLGVLSRAGRELKDDELKQAAERCAGFLAKRIAARQRLAGSAVPWAADDLAFAAWGLAMRDPADKSSAALLKELAADFRDERAAQFFVATKPAVKSWPRAHLLAALPGEPPASEWALANTSGLPPELRRLIERRVSALLDDSAGNPPGELLAAGGSE